MVVLYMQLVSVKIGDGVDDENFIDVSEALYNEREQIIQEHNEGVE